MAQHRPELKKPRANLPYIHQFFNDEIKPGKPRIAIFADVFKPLINGVVFSVDGLCKELFITFGYVILVTPKMPGQTLPMYAWADMKIDLPSFPLPGKSGYRGFLPWLSKHMRFAVGQADVVHAHSFFLGGLLARSAARAARVPLVVTYHTMLDAYAHYAGWAEPLVRFWLRLHIRAFANSVDMLTVPTQAVCNQLRRIGVTAPISIIPSGIDVEVFDQTQRDETLVRELRVHEGDALILCVTRLAEEKNLSLLLAAFARLQKPATLVIVGDGPLRRKLEKDAIASGIASRIRFLGMLDRARLANIYLACDVFAFPSMTETQGLVIAEALYATLPIVVIDTLPAREITAGSDARLVQAQSDVFCAALEEVLAGNSNETLRTARKQVGARYDRRTTARQMMELYRNLIHE